jgi:hypothetical protein
MSGLLLLLKTAAVCEFDQAAFRDDVLPARNRFKAVGGAPVASAPPGSLESIKIACGRASQFLASQGNAPVEPYFAAAPDSFTTFAHFSMSAFR